MSLTTVIPLLGTAGTISFAAIKQALNYAKRTKAETQIKLSDAQSTVGNVKAMAADLKDSLTGEKDKLQSEYDSLKNQAETTKTELEGVITVKDTKIIEVQDLLSKAQAELSAEKSKILALTIARDEYKNKATTLEKVTRN